MNIFFIFILCFGRRFNLKTPARINLIIANNFRKGNAILTCNQRFLAVLLNICVSCYNLMVLFYK